MKFFKKACLISLCCLMATQSMAGAMNKDNAVKVSTVKVEKKKSKSSLKTAVAYFAGGTALTVLTGATLYYFFGDEIFGITVGNAGSNLTREDLKKYAKKEKVKIDGLIPRLGGFAGREFETDVVHPTSIKIRDGVTGIDEKAFYDCEGGICRIFIPKSVKDIGENAFRSMFWFRPKIIYDGEEYCNTEEFFKAFTESGGNIIKRTNS